MWYSPQKCFCAGTWQTYVVKEQTVWHKIDKSTPMEYAATVTVNPLTALRMLEDFVTLKPGCPVLNNMVSACFHSLLIFS